jgi:hypothetical protein
MAGLRAGLDWRGRPNGGRAELSRRYVAQGERQASRRRLGRPASGGDGGIHGLELEKCPIAVTHSGARTKRKLTEIK